MKKRNRSPCSIDTCASCSSADTMRSALKKEFKLKSHIKDGLRQYNPAAIVLWAFMKLPQYRGGGLTSRRVINFLKQRYRLIDNPANTGKSISSILRCAVDFGLLEKRGNRYFLLSE